MALNLHAAVRAPIQAVNPDVDAIYLQSTGSYQTPDFGALPAYATPIPIRAQLQPPTTRDLRHAEFLNMQANFRVVYLYSNPQALVRVSAKGGDVLMFPQNQPHVVFDSSGRIVIDSSGQQLRASCPLDLWLVTHVDEFYDINGLGWSKLYVTLQADGRQVLLNSSYLPVLNSNGGLVYAS